MVVALTRFYGKMVTVMVNMRHTLEGEPIGLTDGWRYLSSQWH